MRDLPNLLGRLAVPVTGADVVLDTDTFNEVDDQFALSFLLRSPERIRLRAVTAAPFLNGRSVSPEDGMEKSYNEILRFLALAGREELGSAVYRGSRMFLPDEKTPVSSPAAEVIASLASQYSPLSPLYIVAIGAITNVASALLLSPEIADNITVIWLGGHSFEYADTAEFNMKQDVAAARVIFNSGTALVQLPCCGVASAFSISGPELQTHLAGKNELCDYLVKTVMDEANAYRHGRVWSRVIWDVTAAAWLLNDNECFLKTRLVTTPLPEYNHTYTFRKDAPLMRYAYYVERDALFNALFDALTEEKSKE